MRKSLRRPSGTAITSCARDITSANKANSVHAAQHAKGGADPITPESIGAAPGGYGLGGTAKFLTEADDVNAIWETGYYSWHVSSVPKNTPEIGLTADVYYMLVCGYGKEAYYQEIIPATNGADYTCANNNKLVRSRYGVIKGWDWVNPPMLLGVEYRTTERYLGKPVYTIAFNFGALPASGEKLLYAPVAANVSGVIACGGCTSNGEALPFLYPTGNGVHDIKLAAIRSVNGGIAVGIGVSKDRSNETATVWVKYTKTTD